MTLTLWGDVIISFFLTLFADQIGRKLILCVGALLMVGSGIVFGLCENYWLLLAAAILGVISPSGGEIGPFRAIEESTLAHLTEPEVRSDIYAWYTLLASAGTACGMVSCGFVVSHLESLEDWNRVKAYRTIFFAYAVLGFFKFLLALSLSKNIEAEGHGSKPQDPNERAPLLDANDAQDREPRKKKSFSLLPSISKESMTIVVVLCLFFALDSLASGLVPLSWTTVFFRRRFSLEEDQLGSIFFTTSTIAALSTLVASSIAKRIGNVKAMVFTHLPSSVALALIPVPSQLSLALFFLIARSCTQMMDVAPRSAFLAAVVLPHERTAVMGTINVVKTFSQSLGPTLTGFLAAKQLFWISFVTAGSLKAAYDLGMLAVFAGHVSREEQAKRAAVQRDEENDDDQE